MALSSFVRCLAGAVLLARAAGAQAPVVTTSGDPSVRADTIYRLAVDPKGYPEEQLHWLLDDGIVRVEADGRVTATYRQVMQVLTERGAEGEREREYSYSPGRQKLTINWVRVVRPNGSIVSATPAHMQESDVAAPLSADPVYGDTRVIRMSLSGVEPGTIVDASYTTEDTLPPMRGSFYNAWRITPGVRVERSRYIVDVPAGMKLRISEQNVRFKRSERTANGRTTYMWATSGVEKIEPEMFAADSTNSVVQTVTVGSPTEWSDVARWYAGLARDRMVPSPAVRSKVAALVSAARTRSDTIRAIHRWVAQDIRYVGIELGQGGYQPRAPDSVIATGFGDCKDKATLFIAALRAAGITAYPVLLNSYARASPEFPGVGQFNHAIAVVPGTDGTLHFADLTATYYPFGTLPPAEQGGFALIVHPDGRGEAIVLPRDSTGAARIVETIAGTLSDSGVFSGTHETRLEGAGANDARALFAVPLDSATRSAVATTMARHDFAHARGDTLIAFDGKDYAVPVRVTVRMTAPDALTRAGNMLLFDLPLSPPGKLDVETERKLLRQPRRFPIDVGRVSPDNSVESELRVTLPAGWKALLPSDVVIPRGPFGSYEARYSQVGRDLIVRKRRTGARGILPPERIGDVVAWFKALGKDDAKFVVLQPPDGAR